MPSFPDFNIQIEDIYKKFMKDKFIQYITEKRKYKMHYHMHPNRRLKKLLFIYAFPIKKYGRESSVPFFTISINKMNKNEKEEFKCIYNNFFVGGIKELKLKFSTKEDEKSIQKNIKELKKIIKVIKLAFNNLTKELKQNVNFYKQ